LQLSGGSRNEGDMKPTLALYGGSPVRTEPLPLEFPGVHRMDEEEIDAVTGARYALAVSSGTGALHVALSALGVGPGQEVILPAYFWVSCAAADSLFERSILLPVPSCLTPTDVQDIATAFDKVLDALC